MHPWGVRSAMYLFLFEKSANLKHPSAQYPQYESLELSHKWTEDNEYPIKSIFVHFSRFFIFPARNKFNLQSSGYSCWRHEFLGFLGCGEL